VAKNSSDHLPSALDRETRRQILKVAEELFLARGYKGVSMKDVAEAVQVTPAALYYHFPQGKEDLFMSTIQALFEGWAAGVSRAIAPARRIRERLQLLTEYLLTLPVNHFPTLAQDAHEHMKDREKQRAIFHQLREMFMRQIVDVFQQAKDAGEIRADISIPALANMYQGMIIASLQHKHISAKKAEIVEVSELSATLIAVLLDGIKQPVQPDNS